MVNAYFVVPLFLAFNYIRNQEESTDTGKNMYTNWNIITLQKNTLVWAFCSTCGKQANTVYILCKGVKLHMNLGHLVDRFFFFSILEI